MALLRCPTCEKTFESEKSPAMPFCSERCQQIDLYGWLTEQHGLPVERHPEDDEGEGY